LILLNSANPIYGFICIGKFGFLRKQSFVSTNNRQIFKEFSFYPFQLKPIRYSSTIETSVDLLGSSIPANFSLTKELSIQISLSYLVFDFFLKDSLPFHHRLIF
jgi:hypothetical protein